jgi:hypothetical protein
MILRTPHAMVNRRLVPDDQSLFVPTTLQTRLVFLFRRSALLFPGNQTRALLSFPCWPAVP